MSRQGSPIWFPYRLLFLYLEPVAALGGTFMAHFTPSYYLTIISPLSTPLSYDSTLQVIFDQLAACYFFIGWTEVVVLRSTDDVKVWKAVLLGLLGCDLLHLYGASLAMGSLFWNLGAYRSEDWISVGSLVCLVAARMAFLMGLGLDEKRRNMKVKKRPSIKGI